MANWHPRDQRNDNYRERIRRNYEDVEFATKPESDRRDYERDVLCYRSGNSDARMSDYNRTAMDREDYRRGRYRTELDYEQMYDAATRDYAGYGDGGFARRQTVDRDISSTGNRYNADFRADRANDRDVGRYTERSAYNPASRGRDFSPDEFRRGRDEANAVYGVRGVQSRDDDFYRNRSELYDGRPEARGYRPDEETSRFAGSHRGKGPKDYKRSDERIREDVNDRLTDAHDLDASSISVSVKDGEVTLSGSVDSKFAKRRAEDIADAATGVSHVQNNLRVRQEGSESSSYTGSSTAGASSSSTGRRTSGV